MKRSFSLDLARALAILLVLAHHLNAMAPGPGDWTRRVTSLGAVGVDLFFVLSGWLIGNLYWGELERTGRVRALRFVLSRMARTLPPYWVALPVAWAGVAYARGQGFDLGYLAFLQNYYPEIPFFFASWSLCVEEHFYLLLPLVAYPFHRSRRALDVCFGIGLLLPTLLRIGHGPAAEGAPFGFYLTATHLRYEGLLLGVWMAHYAHRSPAALPRLVRLGRVTLLPLATAFLALSGWGGALHYPLHSLATALFFSALLLTLVGLRSQPSAALESAVRAVSVSSYSAYLVHSMVIQGVMLTLARLGAPESRLAYFALVPIAILAATASFHVAVEKPVLAMRQRLFPSPNRSLRLTVVAEGTGGPLR